MKRQEDLDRYDPDLQWERMQDRIMTALCIIVMMLVSAFIYQNWEIGQLVRMIE